MRLSVYYGDNKSDDRTRKMKYTHMIITRAFSRKLLREKLKSGKKTQPFPSFLLSLIKCIHNFFACEYDQKSDLDLRGESKYYIHCYENDYATIYPDLLNLSVPGFSVDVLFFFAEVGDKLLFDYIPTIHFCALCILKEYCDACKSNVIENLNTK